MSFHGRIEDRLLERLMRRRLERVRGEREAEFGEMEPSESAPAAFAAQEELIARYAPGKSFIDLACLWKMDGACAFLAEQHGASQVTASDYSPASEGFEAERERRSSEVEFARADLHDTDQVAALGVHDVVWCSGFMYHTPSPFLAMANVLQITGEYLIVGSKVIPAVPGMPGAAAYYPGLSADEREAFAPVTGTVATQPFTRERQSANWFWGLSPQALVGLARSIAAVELVEEVHLPWCRRHDSYYAVLRKAGDAA